MNTIPFSFIPAVGAGLIATLAALLWRISDKARDEKAVRARLAQLRETQLGAYEKARIDRFLNGVNTGQVTFGRHFRRSHKDYPRLLRDTVGPRRWTSLDS
jgi:hypothetical protein